MNTDLRDIMGSLLGTPVKNMTPLSGGDIAQAYQISTATDRFFCKLLFNPGAYDMLLQEHKGLKAIREAGTIKTPEVYFCEPWKKGAVLLMEFVEAKRPSAAEMVTFGRQLALLHQKSASFYGWESDNYIGSLPQSNRVQNTWPEFYVKERLQPQLKMARDRNLLEAAEIPSVEVMSKVLEELSPDVQPSLLHGDLWSGNYLIRIDGTPYIIDPAIYYGHHEVDIAMSMLFGGFNDRFYRAYEEVLPLGLLSSDRIKIYQLYYLLVHLNLFGTSYYSGVKAILKSYFY